MTPRQFIRLVQQDCSAKGVQFKVTDGAFLVLDGLRCNGYFVEEPTPILAVATGKSSRKWFKTLVHEYCHMLQWLEQTRKWKDSAKSDYMWSWFVGEDRVTRRQAYRSALYALDLELDCERRVLRLIKKLDLPIDPVRYAQEANAYVYFYYAALKHKRWYEVGKEPYSLPRLVDRMPKHLRGKHHQISKRMLQTFEKHLGWS